MTAVVVIAAAAALACPLHMLWATRRGKRSACCPPRTSSDLARLRTRQRALGAQIASTAESVPGREASL